ncbi:DUF3558 domain-containing protein [Amycolatopsis sp. CA-128772]|uniref:DUF3558 domain-containing protein n=1 Tax=Amycolatopsis sp. CA-128772 TaxID=2073159 RepID=UPI000CD2230D|nr:DUF3558 domain-containing protein [Amycolatopsis sp. CA-128772]
MKRRELTMVLSVAVLLTGCSSGVTGHATPSTSTLTSVPAPGGDPDVPKVVQPLDTARYEQDPCAALTKDQLAQLRITISPEPDPSNLGPGCDWNAFDEVGFRLDSKLLTSGSNLANIYKLQKQGEWSYFKAIADVSGYPGVLVDDDNPPKNTCQLMVGLRDDLVYSVQISVSPDSQINGDPCPTLQKVGEMAVSTMKAGA